MSGSQPSGVERPLLGIRPGALRPPANARLLGDPISAARKAIGDEVIDRALAAGRSMDPDSSLAYVRAD